MFIPPTILFFGVDQASEGYNMSEKWWTTIYQLFENGKLLSLYKKGTGLIILLDPT